MNKKTTVAAIVAALGLAAAAQDLGGIKEKTLQYRPLAESRPLTNAVVAWKPLPGALTNAVPAKRVAPVDSVYIDATSPSSGGYWLNGSYFGYSDSYRGAFTSSSYGWWGNAYGQWGWYSTTHNSSRRGL